MQPEKAVNETREVAVRIKDHDAKIIQLGRYKYVVRFTHTNSLVLGRYREGAVRVKLTKKHHDVKIGQMISLGSYKYRVRSIHTNSLMLGRYDDPQLG